MRDARDHPAFGTPDIGLRHRADITHDETVHWPDPSPLQSWWDSVMNREITMHPDETTAAHRWLIRCDRCDHLYGAVAASLHDANHAARTNGWIVDDESLCPGCAHVAQAQSHAAPATGAA